MKIPEHAKLVHKGVVFDVFQWEQELFDGSTTTFEGLNRRDTALVIPILENGNIVVINEEQPWATPRTSLLGGGRESDEEMIDTAKREMLEEAGLTSEDWQKIRVYTPSGKIEWDIHVFVARNCKRVAEPLNDPGEKIEQVELNFDDFVKTVCSRGFWDQGFACDVLRAAYEDKLNEFKSELYGG